MSAIQDCGPAAELSGRASQGRGADAAFRNSSGRASPVARRPGIARKTSSMNFCAAKEGSRVGEDTCAAQALMDAEGKLQLMVMIQRRVRQGKGPNGSRDAAHLHSCGLAGTWMAQVTERTSIKRYL